MRALPGRHGTARWLARHAARARHGTLHERGVRGVRGAWDMYAGGFVHDGAPGRGGARSHDGLWP